MKLFNVLCTFCVVAFFFISCKKQKEGPLVLPAAEASLNRNLVFINQSNTEKNVSYGTSKVKVNTGAEDGQFYMRFSAESNQVDAASEYVTLYINASHLTSNLAKSYTFGSVEPALNRVYYTYFFNESATGTWGSATDSKTGVVFEGSLNITAHDPKKKLISGSFTVKARRLINDPTVRNLAAPIDPANQCDLTLTGTFKNVQLQ